ncbi:tail completion [Proteus phage Myduc]|uniref:Phage neck terminator protein gp12-like domain-containing protein n=1 Tax=Proteus phage Myduc TaxID=2650874 RepID=A0A5J6T7B8_9CAUD|nr:tail completion [Proteus phage Myduc]QFG06683.1 hypothetical protein CPT_Myduc_061 [Proteus phage Myduc]
MDIQKEELLAIKKIVDQAVGIPNFSYEAQLNAPRPSGNYAVIKCLESMNPAFDEIKIGSNEKGETTYTTVGIRVLTFDIMFNRDGQEYIDFDNSFYRPDVQAVCKKYKMFPLGKEPLKLASLTLETNWEVRKGIRMQFNVKREQMSVVGTMSGADIRGEFFDGNTSEEVNISIRQKEK